jgi:MoaA/NifB/PqqE/SkfB family radical SAM enzyme
MKMFNSFDLETSALCNRTCATCLRNSHPDREAVQRFFTQAFMPMEMIQQVLDQAVDLGYEGKLCLCHWNEPLMDPRIVEIVRLAKSYNKFFVYFVTNGDFLTDEIAGELDGLLDRVVVSLYYNGKAREEAARWIRQAFPRSQVQIKGDHRVSHFYNGAIADPTRRCRPVPRRLIMTHRGEYLLCCEDLLGEFSFGRFPEVSLKDYWFGEKHTKILGDLSLPGGRAKYPYCATCPSDVDRRCFHA